MSLLSVKGLSKTYNNGQVALDQVNLDVERGEIFALLGPNGAGKTTLISSICGLVVPSSGSATVAGFDTQKTPKETRARIGLVPQELAADGFETVMNAVRYSRALFGKPKDDAYLVQLLRDLSLFDKRDAPVVALSGGMKRRVLIAKALSHQPDLLFLDEPTAGVDVSLRKDLWNMVRRLRDSGTTIVLTTHYIDEAENLADRIGIINHGRLDLVEAKERLIERLGKKELFVYFEKPINAVPTSVMTDGLSVRDGALVYQYSATGAPVGLTTLLRSLLEINNPIVDIESRKSSLEDIFVDLVGDQ